MLKAIEKHTDCAWVKLYIKRWLTAPIQFADGTQQARDRGTPQGGVVSPLLANLYLHYVFDKWLELHYPTLEWCRYADDGLVHCRSEAQAQFIHKALKRRFECCGLELHPSKTKIVYCKDDRRTGDYLNTSFDFLSFTFRRRGCWVAQQGRMILGFAPAVSKEALNRMRATIRNSRLRQRTDLSLQEIASWLNPILQGWMNYYGAYYRSAMYSLIRYVNKSLVRWAIRKYKSLRRGKHRAVALLERIAKKTPQLFIHWRKEMIGAFA